MKPSPIAFIMATAMLVSLTVILLTHSHHHHAAQQQHFYIEH